MKNYFSDGQCEIKDPCGSFILDVNCGPVPRKDVLLLHVTSDTLVLVGDMPPQNV